MMTSFQDRLPATLFTQRLTLVTPSLDHVPEMAQLAKNKRIHAVLSRLPHPYTETHGREFVTQIARSQTEHAWSIMIDDRYLGTIGLHLLPEQLPELGYWLGEPHWGQGFATEAALAVVAATREAGATALRSRALLTNAASLNVLRKIGFEDVEQSVDTSGTLIGQAVMLMRLDFER